MTITIVSDPEYPTLGEEVELTITGGTAYQVGLFTMTAVPNRSELETGTVASRNETAGDPGSALLHYFTPDIGGPYTFRVDVMTEYRVASREAPSAPTELRRTLDETITGTVHVGAWFELPIRTTHGHGATLGLLIVNSTVRQVRCTDFLTDLSRSAFLETVTQSAYESLLDITVSDLDHELVADTQSLLTNVKGHFAEAGTIHPGGADATTVIGVDAPHSPQAAIDTLNRLHDGLMEHMTDDGTWHSVDDTKNLPAVAKATTLGEATVLRADLRERVYERHRVQVDSPATHGTADGDNPMSNPSRLQSFIVAFIDAIVDADPIAVAGESEGHMDIQHSLGFVVAG
jgi:hypothetical protein